MLIMKKHVPFILKLIVASIMLQTLFFKFTGAQESIDLFIKVAGKNEAIVRIGTGIIELIASFLLFTPKKTWLGAFLTIGLMSGAVLFHITKIGIVHNNDGGILFSMAIITFLSSIVLLYLNRKEIPLL